MSAPVAESPSLVVAVANGAYARLDALPDVTANASDVAAALRDRHGYSAIELLDRPRGVLLDEIEAALAEGSLVNGSLIVLWSGHGRLNEASGLELLAKATDSTDGAVFMAERLGQLAARTGASRILVVLDTCHSGGGVHLALSLADAVLSGRADASHTWFGVIASARVDEPARTGAMARDLIRLLTDGPRTEEMLIRWSPYREGVPGVDLMIALGSEWSERRHDQHSGQLGTNLEALIRNPRHLPRAPHRVVEHLLQAARGSSSATENFFTGRDAILAALVGSLRGDRAGLVVLTGPPGSGKSAILGRLVSLSHPDERSRLPVNDLDPTTDPGPDAVDAHLHMRGLDFKTALRDLAEQLGLHGDSGLFDVLALAARRHLESDPLVVVLDGLDEAGEAGARDLAVRLIQPLATEALVLVGTREIPGAGREPGLIALLGPALQQVDLATGIEQELADVRRYVLLRLAEAPPEMDADAIADEVVALARSANPAVEGPFLLARLITAQLRADPLDTSVPDWRSSLATSVEEAFERDLDSVVLSWGGEIHATAGRELLRALACAHGNGFPPDDVWPAVATALSPTGTSYTRDQVYQVVPLVARYVVAAAEGDLAVYRIAHQRLIDHLRPTVDSGSERRLSPKVAVPVSHAITKLYTRLLDEGLPAESHTYLWRHAWRHWADAGDEGLRDLRGLAARDRDSFLEDLALVTDVQSHTAWWRGDAARAIELSEELIAVRREMGDDLGTAIALFESSFRRSTAGDAVGAEEVAAEALDLAEAVGDSPEHRRMLAATLTVGALSQIRLLNADGAVELARQSINLLEPEIGEHPELEGLLSSAYVVQAQALMMRGEWSDAVAPARRAVQLVDPTGEAEVRDTAFIEALALQANVEVFTELARAGAVVLPGRSPGRAEPSGPPSHVNPATERLIRILDRTGSTGTIGDLPFANALVNKTRLLGSMGSPAERDARLPERLALLDRAIELATPLAGTTVDGAAVLSTALLLHAPVVGSLGDGEQAVDDLRRAQAVLRVFADTSPFASMLLGEVLLSYGRAVAAGAVVEEAFAPPAARSAAALDILKEAVTRLEGSSNPMASFLLYDALAVVLMLHVALVQRSEALLVAQRQVELARLQDDGSATAKARLATALSDLAGMAVKDDPLGGLAAAAEAVELLESDVLEPSPLLAYSLVNRGAAEMTIGRNDDARATLERAEALFEAASPDGPGAVRVGEPETPIFTRFLALALNNLAVLDLNDGDARSALERAERSYRMLSDPAAAGDPTLITTARFTLAQATQATGDTERAAELLSACLDDLRARLESGELGIRDLAAVLNAGSGRMWDDVLADLEDQPELVKGLVLWRLPQSGDFASTASMLASALAEAETLDTVREIRAAARQARSVGGRSFDDAWISEVGALPDWLEIPFEVIREVYTWLGCPTWQQSKDHLAAHPALLDPATDIILREWIDPDDPDDEAAVHLDLLATVRTRGIDEGYRRHIAIEVAVGLLTADDTRSYLDGHREQLVGDDVSEWVREEAGEGTPEAVFLEAMLVLVRRGEEELCLRLLDDPAAGAPLLQTARRAGDIDRLLAITCLMSDDDESDAVIALETAVSRAIGQAIGGTPESAAATLGAALEHGTPADRDQATLWITDALGHHRAHRDGLLSLLDQVSAFGSEPAQPVEGTEPPVT